MSKASREEFICAIKSHISNGARSNGAETLVLGVDVWADSFEIVIRHTLVVSAVHKTHIGLIKPGDRDFSSQTLSRCENEIRQRVTNALSDKRVLSLIANDAKSRPYGYMAQTPDRAALGGKVLHPYYCSHCQGHASVACNHCGGGGSQLCISCSCTGLTTCTVCYGQGFRIDSRWVENGRTVEKHVPCGCNHGRVKCGQCNGTGEIICSSCYGRGVVTCPTCDGHGKLTTVTTLMVTTEPSYIGYFSKDATETVWPSIKKIGCENIENYGFLPVFIDSEISTTKPHTDLRYRCETLFCTADVEISGRNTHWLLAGTPPHVIDDGGALESLLKDDLDRLISLPKSLVVFNPWFYRRAKSVVTSVMSSGLNSEIIERSYLGENSGRIYDSISRRASQDYIETLLKSLRLVLVIARFWSTVKWTISVSILSIAFVFFYVCLADFFDPTYSHEGIKEVRTNIDDRFLNSDAGELRYFMFPKPREERPQLPITLASCIALIWWAISRWSSSRWIDSSGGQNLKKWARSNKLLVGKFSCLLMFILSAICSNQFYDRFPIWRDLDGRLYGVLPIYPSAN